MTLIYFLLYLSATFLIACCIAEVDFTDIKHHKHDYFKSPFESVDVRDEGYYPQQLWQGANYSPKYVTVFLGHRYLTYRVPESATKIRKDYDSTSESKEKIYFPTAFVRFGKLYEKPSYGYPPQIEYTVKKPVRPQIIGHTAGDHQLQQSNLKHTRVMLARHNKHKSIKHTK